MNKRNTPLTKTSQPYIPSYAKGGVVTKPRASGVYTAEMGQPPQDIDSGSAPRKKAPNPDRNIYTADKGKPPQDIDSGSAPRKKK